MEDTVTSVRNSLSYHVQNKKIQIIELNKFRNIPAGLLVKTDCLKDIRPGKMSGSEDYKFAV